MPMGLKVCLLLILLAVAAGCAGPASPVKGGAPSASFDGESGGIEGVVMDDEERPLSGATVQLVGAHRSTNTTEDGRFAFSQLPPTTYLLLAEKSGFVKRQVPVDVPQGNVSRVRIALAPVPPPLPYADAGFTLNGYIRGGYSYRVASTSGNGSGNSGGAVPEAARTINTGTLYPKAGWQTILIEVGWTPASQHSDQLALNITFPEKLEGGAVSTATQRAVTGGDAPLRWRWDRDDFEEARKKRANLSFETFVGLRFAVTTATSPNGLYDVGVYVEQKFTVYATVGYNGPLDPSYSRLPP